MGKVALPFTVYRDYVVRLRVKFESRREFYPRRSGIVRVQLESGRQWHLGLRCRFVRFSRALVVPDISIV